MEIDNTDIHNQRIIMVIKCYPRLILHSNTYLNQTCAEQDNLTQC